MVRARHVVIFCEPEANAGHPGPPGAPNSLCVCTKHQQISVRNERYVNCLQMSQCKFTVPSTHTRIWFANHSRVVCEPFGSHVCTGLYHIKVCLHYVCDVYQHCRPACRIHPASMWIVNVSCDFFLIDQHVKLIGILSVFIKECQLQTAV